VAMAAAAIPEGASVRVVANRSRFRRQAMWSKRTAG